MHNSPKPLEPPNLRKNDNAIQHTPEKLQRINTTKIRGATFPTAPHYAPDKPPKTRITPLKPRNAIARATTPEEKCPFYHYDNAQNNFLGRNLKKSTKNHQNKRS